MKRLMTMALVVLMAGTALAQFENSMGVFFVEDELTQQNTNMDTEAGVDFNMYLAVINTTLNFVGGYECSIAATDDLIVLGWGGPDSFWEEGEYAYPDGFSYGGFNFGDNFNHLVGYSFPVPTGGVSAVLSKMRVMYMGSSTVELTMGPSEPSSVGGAGPAIANGIDPDDLVVCTYTSGPDLGGLVGTLNGAGIEFPVATETQSWSNVKSLF